MNPRSSQAGLSLIELMISITLGLLIVAALIAVFSQNSKSFRQNDANAQMQDNARFALDTLSRDLSMAGYFGGIYDNTNIQTQPSPPFPGLTRDCGVATGTPQIAWAFQTTRLEFVDGGSGSAPFASCLGQSDTPVVAGTDVVAIRHTAGQSKADLVVGAGNPTLCDHTFYLQSNGTQGTLFNTTTLTSCASYGAYTDNTPAYPPMSFYKWIPRVYFVRSYARSSGDGTPALCRMELQHTANPTMLPECIADGIENLQIDWGLDTDNDCVPDTYTNAPDFSNPANQPVTARIWLIARTTQADWGYTDTKTFVIGNVTVPPPVATGPTDPAPHYHRRLYTTTVQLRNPVGSSSVGPCTFKP